MVSAPKMRGNVYKDKKVKEEGAEKNEEENGDEKIVLQKK